MLMQVTFLQDEPNFTLVLSYHYSNSYFSRKHADPTLTQDLAKTSKKLTHLTIINLLKSLQTICFLLITTSYN